MIETIGLVSGIFTEWFLEELLLQQVGKALSRSTPSHKDFTQTEGALWMSCTSTFLGEHGPSKTNNPTKKSALIEYFLLSQHVCGQQNDCSAN